MYITPHLMNESLSQTLPQSKLLFTLLHPVFNFSTKIKNYVTVWIFIEVLLDNQIMQKIFQEHSQCLDLEEITSNTYLTKLKAEHTASEIS